MGQHCFLGKRKRGVVTSAYSLYDVSVDKNSKIYQVALTLFNEFGLQKVNMQEIADNAGVSKKTLYNHFKGKEDLFDRTIEWNIHSILEFYTTLDRDKKTPLIEKINQAIQFAYRSLSYKNNKIFKDLQRKNRYINDSPIVYIQSKIHLFISHLVTEAQEAGICRTDIPANTITHCLFLLMSSILSWDNITEDPEVNHLQLFNTTFSLFIESLLIKKGSIDLPFTGF